MVFSFQPNGGLMIASSYPSVHPSNNGDDDSTPSNQFLVLGYLLLM